MDAAPEFPCRLSVTIVLHHTAPELLQRALSSLYRAASVARDAGLLRQLDLTLVDNSCDAAYRESLSGQLGRFTGPDFCHIAYAQQSENRGFGAGQNVGLRSARSSVHLILNPDVELEPDALQAGLSHLQRNRNTVLVSPQVFAENGSREFLCKRYPSVWVLFLRAFAPAFVQARFRASLEQYEMVDVCAGDEPAEVPLASGCFMLSPTSSLNAIGGFDEGYFLYFEDFDLSLRLAGQGRLVYEPAVRIVHHGGYAARKGVRHVLYFVRSGIRFFNVHGWRWF